jgi:hypothetical protein
MYTTKTTLVGDGTAVLYQVLDGDKKLHINQLTSVTVSEEDGMRRRIRSAQALTPQGHPMAMSYYRERGVGEEEFFTVLAATLIEYNILPSDTCAWMDYGPKPTNYPRGIYGCVEHLLGAFEIKGERCSIANDCTQKMVLSGSPATSAPITDTASIADSTKQQYAGLLLGAASIYVPSICPWVLYTCRGTMTLLCT